MTDSPDDTDALPEPPPDLAKRSLPFLRRSAGERFVRIHHMSLGAIWFGWDVAAATFRSATNRFDAFDRSFGVLYMAATRDGAFAESVGKKPRSFRSDHELEDLRLTTLELTREIRIVDLHGGEAVGSIGATGVVGLGPQSLARRWSHALQNHPEKPDGIEYRCRHNSDELALALFHRVGNEVLVLREEVALTSDRTWLATMRARHHIWAPPA